MSNDAVSLAMIHAVRSFGGKGRDGLFNVCGFSEALMRIAGAHGFIGPDVVRAILCGRADVIPQSDGAHYKYIGLSGDRK